MGDSQSSKNDVVTALEQLRQRLSLRQAAEARAAWTRAEEAVTQNNTGVFGSRPPHESRSNGGNGRNVDERGRPDARVFEVAPLGIVTLRRDGTIVACNPALVELCGYTEARVTGRSFSDFVHPDDAARLRNQFESLVADGPGGYCQCEVRCYRRNADFVWVSLTAATSLEADGNELQAVVTVQDISERRSVEQSLRAANERLTTWVAELERRSHEHGLVSETGDLLQACRSAEEAYQVIGQMGRRLFLDESGSVSVTREAHNLVEAVATWGTPCGEPVFGPEACWALRRGRPHLVQGEDAGPVCRHMPALSGAAYLCVPMMAYGEALGVLTVSLPADERLSEARQRLATTVAEHIALALANLKLQETLRHQSIRDPLTGLFNRRYMEESLEREMRRAGRSRQPVGIIMLDLDHFKEFNDAHGHETGDALLREVGAVLQRGIRGEDIACRYGGEEFVLILPEASLPDAAQRAEHLREAIGAIDVLQGRSPIGRITVSMGVALYPDHGLTSRSVLRAADAALYRAKAQGRNRVEVNDGPSSVAEPLVP